jgi:hypothetical protein
MLLGVKICSISPRDDDFPQDGPMKLGIFLILLGYMFIASYQFIENMEKEIHDNQIIHDVFSEQL